MAVLSLLLSLVFVLVFVAIAWTLFWKFVLEPNPLIRDFFDLEKEKRKPSQPNEQRTTPKNQIKRQ
jgi:hypothetical protein